MSKKLEMIFFALMGFVLLSFGLLLFTAVLTFWGVITPVKADEPSRLYLCQSKQYSLIIGRTRNCPGIERKMRRALRISLEANYRADGLSARSAREQAKRAMGTYVCGWRE
jgi:hypothetical protein